MNRVFVSGATGNVGSHLVKAIEKSADLELAGGFCRAEGVELGHTKTGGIVYGTSDLAGGIRKADADLVVDFTSADIIMDNLKVYAKAGLDVVVGTTGFTEEMIQEANKLLQDCEARWAIISNFGFSANLVVEFLKKIGKHYPYVTIIDRHHAKMANAPSGTAMTIAKALSEGPEGNVASKEALHGVMGGRVGRVQILSQRTPAPGTFSEHEIILGRQDELVRIAVQDFSSRVYVEGVLLALRKIGSFPPGSLVSSLSAFEE